MPVCRSRTCAGGTDSRMRAITSGGKLGGLSVSEARRLKALEAENTRLKKLLAEAMLEQEVTREVLRKKW